MAKKKAAKAIAPNVGWDHPFVAMGFIPEHLLREVWSFEDSYWPDWLGDNEVPAKSMNGIRWFYSPQLGDWFRDSAKRKKKPQD